jgi:hypothetical protein
MSSTTSSTQQLVWSADSPRSVCEKRIFDPFPSKCCLIRLKKVLFNRIRSQKPRPFRCINGGHDPLQCKTGPSSTTATVQIGYDCMHARTQASKAWMPWQENLWLFSQGPDRPHHCNRRVMGLWWPWLLAQTTHIGFLHFYCGAYYWPMNTYFHTYATVDVCWTTWTEDGPIIALPANASATFWTIGLCLVKGDEIASGQH